jgi:hypothetical protein
VDDCSFWILRIEICLGFGDWDLELLQRVARELTLIFLRSFQRASNYSFWNLSIEICLGFGTWDLEPLVIAFLEFGDCDLFGIWRLVFGIFALGFRAPTWMKIKGDRSCGYRS